MWAFDYNKESLATLLNSLITLDSFLGWIEFNTC